MSNSDQLPHQVPVGPMAASLAREPWNSSSLDFQAIFVQAAIGLAITDLAGQFVYVNPAFCALTGYTEAELFAASFPVLTHPEDRPANRQLLAQLIGGALPGFVTEQCYVHKDGTVVWVQNSVSLLYDAQGGAAQVIVLIEDITPRKQTEAALEERVRLAEFSAAIGQALIQHPTLPGMLQACAQALVQYLHAAFARVWTLNAAGDVLELQASAGLYTHLDGGHSRVPVGQFKIGQIAAQRHPHLTNAVQQDPLVPEQAWALREGLVAFAGYQLLVEDRLVGVMALFARQPLTEVTLAAMATVANGIALGIERKEVETALQQALRLRDDFLAIASHELKTPLTSIKAYAQMVSRQAEGTASPRMQRSLQTIVRQTDRLTALINELLDVSRIASGRLEINCAPLDLGELVAEVAADVQLLTDAHQLETQLAPEALTVLADRDRMRQVLVNLLENAIKYSPEGGPVVVQVSQTPDSAIVHVRDQGIGIPTDQVSHIFEQFYRARNTTGTVYSGMGLGLHISREIISRHDGRLWVESREGGGSTFFFALPRVQPPSADTAV